MGGNQMSVLMDWNFEYSGLDVMAFDFSGSGQSEGYCTIGFREKDDVTTVTEELGRLGYERIVLFGRSMGSAAALFWAAREGTTALRGLVLDSCFTSLEDIIRTATGMSLVGKAAD
jgi:pimeloyl-ACP methyl ester carboxylesterase